MAQKLYQGSSKTLYDTDEEYALIMVFEDSLRLSQDKTLHISGKGGINNMISSYLMQKLDMIGIENHLIEKINMKKQLIQRTEIYPVQIHISTLACDRYVNNLGMEEGFVFDLPVVDYRIKNSRLNYPSVNEHQIINFGWMTQYELKELRKLAIRIHDFLVGLFVSVNIRMVDIKLEFGRVFNGEEFIPMLIDEVSPDTCRLWDMDTNQKLCFEAGIEGDGSQLILAYQEVLSRLNICK